MSDAKKRIRAAFRDATFNRDGHKCLVCKAVNTHLDAHHITDRNEMPNGGYVKENGISLCPECHIKAETWHISGKKDFIPGYHPDDLYKLIGSSYEKAVRSSERLK